MLSVSLYVSQLSSIHLTWWPHVVGVMMRKRETDEGETVVRWLQPGNIGGNDEGGDTRESKE